VPAGASSTHALGDNENNNESVHKIQPNVTTKTDINSMPSTHKPGPECATRKPPLDQGTLCRQHSPSPGPVGAAAAPPNTISYIGGHSKSILLAIVDHLGLKQNSPISTALLEHYVEGSGRLYELKEIPPEWQDWIVKATAGKPGLHRELNPYNSGIYDLRNSLGHFDVTVTRSQVTNKTIYKIQKDYTFGFFKNDRDHRGQHGFPLGNRSETMLSFLRHLLPSRTYENPGGFHEHFEIKKIGKETILIIPQQFLAESGTPFPVTGQFTK